MESVALSLYQAHFFKEKKNICLNKQIKSCISLKIIASCLLRVKTYFLFYYFYWILGLALGWNVCCRKAKAYFTPKNASVKVNKM